MTKDNLTKQQLSTLFLVNAINEIVENHSNEGCDLEEIKYVGDIYFQSFVNDKEDTIQLLKEILELEELGCVKTTYTAEDLQEEDEIPFLLDEDFSIKILIDISDLKSELQIPDEEVEKITEEAWKNDEIRNACPEGNGKETLADYIKEFINSDTTQNAADLINKVGIKTFLISLVIPVYKCLRDKVKTSKKA